MQIEMLVVDMSYSGNQIAILVVDMSYMGNQIAMLVTGMSDMGIKLSEGQYGVKEIQEHLMGEAIQITLSSPYIFTLPSVNNEGPLRSSS